MPVVTALETEVQPWRLSQRAADAIAKALIEAWKKGAAPLEQATAPKN